MMMDWLRIYNLIDFIPFIEALEKTWKQYYPDKMDMLKDAVGIPGISITYVLDRALKMKKPDEPDLYAPGYFASIPAETVLGFVRNANG